MSSDISAPTSTCRNATLRLSGDFLRISAAVSLAQSASSPFSASSAPRTSSTERPENRRSTAAWFCCRPALPRVLVKVIEHQVDRFGLDHGFADGVERARWIAMGRNAEIEGVGLPDGASRQRQIEPALAREARQEVGGAHIRKEPDGHFRHGEADFFRRDAMCAVETGADATAHDDAVDQRHIRLGEALQRPVVLVFGTVELQGCVELAGLAPLVERLQVTAAAEGAWVGRLHDDAIDVRIPDPRPVMVLHLRDHVVGQRVQRPVAVERDEATPALLLEYDVWPTRHAAIPRGRIRPGSVNTSSRSTGFIETMGAELYIEQEKPQGQFGRASLFQSALRSSNLRAAALQSLARLMTAGVVGAALIGPVEPARAQVPLPERKPPGLLLPERKPQGIPLPDRKPGAAAPVQSGQQQSAEDPKPAEPPRAEEAKPVEPQPAEEAKPIEQQRAEEAKPVEPQRAEEAKPIEPPHPSDVETPAWTKQEIADAKAVCAKLFETAKIVPEALAPLRKGQCGAPAPVKVRAIGAEPPVEIAPSATLRCGMAAALGRWLTEVVQPQAVEHLGEPVVRLRNVASYVCRPRYNDRSKRISEHALANALDIAAFDTESGKRVVVLEHWVSPAATEPEEAGSKSSRRHGPRQ